MVNGVHSVVTIGLRMILKSCAISWDIQDMVRERWREGRGGRRRGRRRGEGKGREGKVIIIIIIIMVSIVV